MRKTPFVWLGSGRAKKRDVAYKGRMLDRAAAARLPVPAGGILLHELLEIALAEGLAVREDGAISIPDPVWLHEVLYRDVRFPRLPGPVVIKPAFATPEDAIHLNVDVDDAPAFAAALAAVWNAVPGPQVERRRDVLVLASVAHAASGKATVVPQAAADDVHVCEPQQAQISLPRLRFLRRPAPDLPLYLQRLQKLLRGLHRTYGKGSWAIDWVDDGDVCWLVDVG